MSTNLNSENDSSRYILIAVEELTHRLRDQRKMIKDIQERIEPILAANLENVEVSLDDVTVPSLVNKIPEASSLEISINVAQLFLEQNIDALGDIDCRIRL